ncbi:hypothetical protein L8T01_13185 [Enterobacter roggenkampii]|uniref:hypothetical protein n=1 Tax=Enterobacter roggenkampii TaxID=1812935 RepID=UPI00200442EC|nr:hypothetical protein [Enterobacter roggenkampii]MCK6937141.1 hypothetical protein [Enterobacter roggenkampii]
MKVVSEMKQFRRHFFIFKKIVKNGWRLESEGFFLYFFGGVCLITFVLLNEYFSIYLSEDAFSEALLSFFVFYPILILFLLNSALMVLRFYFKRRLFQRYLYKSSRLVVLKMWQICLPAVFVFIGVGVVCICIYLYSLFSISQDKYLRYAVLFFGYPLALLILLVLSHVISSLRFLFRRDKWVRYIFSVGLLFLFFMLYKSSGASHKVEFEIDNVQYEKLRKLSNDNVKKYAQELFNNALHRE